MCSDGKQPLTRTALLRRTAGRAIPHLIGLLDSHCTEETEARLEHREKDPPSVSTFGSLAVERLDEVKKHYGEWRDVYLNQHLYDLDDPPV